MKNGGTSLQVHRMKALAFFLPEKILEMCFRVLPNPSQAVMTSVAFLAGFLVMKH